MEINCPGCGAGLKVGEKHHYKMIKCPKCGKEFQVLGRETIQLTKDYIEKQMKKDFGKEPEK